MPGAIMADVILRTGEELAAHIHAEAMERGMLISHFLAPVYPTNPAAAFTRIKQALRPTLATVERVNVVLTRKAVMLHARVLVRHNPPAPVANQPTYVDRDPCFYCGTRADIGCRHQEPQHG